MSTVKITLDTSGDQIYGIIVLILLSIGQGTELHSSRSLPDKPFLAPIILLKFKYSHATMISQISDVGDHSNTDDPMGHFMSRRVYHGASLQSSMLIPRIRTFKLLAGCHYPRVCPTKYSPPHSMRKETRFGQTEMVLHSDPPP